jgi:tRNA-uridine 2-sulfurtransferase
VIDLRRAGAVERPDGEGVAGGQACGDRVRITLALQRGRLARVRFGADACPPATAAAAWLAAEAEGAPFLEAARLGTDSAMQALGLPPAARSHVEVAVDAFGAALGDAVARGTALAPKQGLAAVAMSGGVDSAVVLADAADAGAAVGVTLRLWIDPEAPDPERACCAPTAVRRARDACHARGVPHLALDLRDPFRTAVVDPFVAGYAAGATPNPCVRCNGDFRFEALLDAATLLGAERLLTGHYARIAERDGIRVVARGADPRKDQSYMLARLDPAHLERLGFPLGGVTKDETRARARALGLAAADAAESQEVCFLGGGDYRGFLRRSGVPFGDGAVVDEAGRELGRHDGAAGFTPGQRRGVGVAADEPLYVLRTDAPANVVVVAPKGRLGRDRLHLVDARLHVDRTRVDAKLRYRSPAVAATVEPCADGLELRLDRPAFGIAPGQTAALYDGDAVVGVGTIAPEAA